MIPKRHVRFPVLLAAALRSPAWAQGGNGKLVTDAGLSVVDWPPFEQLPWRRLFRHGTLQAPEQ